MKKLIFWVSGILALVLLVTTAVVQMMPYFAPSPHSVGDLVFGQADSATVLTVTVGNEKIKLKKTDGSWKIDGYYARNGLIEDFLHKLEIAVLISPVYSKISKYTDVRVGVDNTFVFSFKVAAAENADQSIVEVEGKNYLVSQNLQLPTDITEYYVQPLLPLKDHKPEQIIGISIKEMDLEALRYYGVIRQLPEKDGAAYKYRSFAIMTADGLKLICGLYKHQDSYWMTVQLKTTIMPTLEADQYVKENGFRYDGWYFLLSERDGSRLYQSLHQNQSRSAS